MPVNPYNPEGSRWSDNKLLEGRVSFEDWFWVFKDKFVHGCTGLMDKVVATLFKKLVDELRKIDREAPLEAAWCVDHPNFGILDDVLDRLTFVERCPVGSDSIGGPTPPQDVAGRIDGIRSEVQPAEVVSPVEESKSKARKRRPKGKEKEVKRRHRARTSGEA